MGNTGTADRSQLDQLIAAINKEMPMDTWPEPPRGWLGEAEAALIDAVYSMRANYGNSPTTGVRRYVHLWRVDRSEHGVATLDDLRELTPCDPVALADMFGNHQRVPGKNSLTKAAAVVEAAKALVAAGFADAASLAADTTGSAEAAYLSVPGLGKVTWTYLLMLLGIPGVKADTWVCRFVNEATASNRAFGSEACARLVVAAADEIDADPIHLDHAIWSHQRTR